MAIPAAVAEQGKKASEAHRAAYPDLYKESAANPTQPPAQPAAPQPPGNTAPATPAPNGLPTPPSLPQPQKGGEDIATLQHKLSVLQGKYNAEVPILQREVNTLRTENAALRTENASLKTAPSPAKEPGKTGSDADPFKRIREDYGDNFADNINAAINARVEEMVAQRTASISEKVSAVQATQVKTAEQTYYEALGKAVPKWMEINGNLDFQNWLGTPERFTGLPYQSLLEHAHGKLDAERVANIFQAWPGFATFGGPPPAQAEDPNKKQLESLIHPNPSAPNNQPPTDPNKPTYTQAQIQAFYDEVRRGLWKSRPKEQAAKELDFGLAYREGRIVG